MEAAMALQAAPVREIVSRSRLDPSNAEPALQELLLSGLLIPLEEGRLDTQSDLLVMALPHWNTLRETILRTVESYHAQLPAPPRHPARGAEEQAQALAAGLQCVNRHPDQAGAVNGPLCISSPGPGTRSAFDANQQAKVQSLKRSFEQNPFNPPGLKECQAEVGVEVMNALVEMGEFIPVSTDVVFRKQDYEEAVGRIRELLQQKERITLAEVRDLLSTSRKYAQALLEHLDATGMTLRDGDYRRLRKR